VAHIYPVDTVRNVGNPGEMPKTRENRYFPLFHDHTDIFVRFLIM